MKPSSKNQAPAKYTAKAGLAKESKEKGEMKDQGPRSEQPTPPSPSIRMEMLTLINTEHENQSLPQTGQTSLHSISRFTGRQVTTEPLGICSVAHLPPGKKAGIRFRTILFEIKEMTLDCSMTRVG